jgi:polyphenol oxidase
MIKKDKNGIYTSSLLSQFPDVIHGFSSKVHGTMKTVKNRKAFQTRLGVDNQPCISMEQIHGNTIFWLTGPTVFSVPGVDGIAWYAGTGTNPIPVLSVYTADCVPMLFFDPKTKIIGAVHAGWKGTLAQISIVMVSSMVTHGAVAKDIHVAIGPHIGACCYWIDERRKESFASKNMESWLILVNRIWHADLGKINYEQLLQSGVLGTHIDTMVSCTSCQNDSFFSYRKEGENTGRMIGIISYKTN